jgi:hypothetical protein
MGDRRTTNNEQRTTNDEYDGRQDERMVYCQMTPYFRE